jgi:ferritin
LIKFSDLQTLQRLRNELLSTQNTLASCLDISKQLKTHCHSLDALALHSGHDCTIELIKSYSADISVYVHSVATILESLRGTQDMVCHTLIGSSSLTLQSWCSCQKLLNFEISKASAASQPCPRRVF